MTSEPGSGRDSVSEKGWVRATCDPRYWIPCPAGFPPGMDRDSWATAMSRGWWEQSGLAHQESSAGLLATMLRTLHERAYATVVCHQIWIYLRDPALPPLPVFLGIWKQRGDRRPRLRELAGADDKASAGKPQVTEYKTGSLGPGLRVMRHRKARKGTLAVLSYAFRSDEFETDVQVFVSWDPRALETVTGDIEQFVDGLTVYGNSSPAQLAQP
jgi:hypothetical protein